MTQISFKSQIRHFGSGKYKTFYIRIPKAFIDHGFIKLGEYVVTLTPVEGEGKGNVSGEVSSKEVK